MKCSTPKTGNYYNTIDCNELGYPPGTIYKIEGKDYIVNKEGWLSIPEGVICTPERVQIMRPGSEVNAEKPVKTKTSAKMDAYCSS